VELKTLNNRVVATHSQPLVSIITVVLNGAKTLEKAIKSVIHQKFKNYEYIIVDGNSVDGSIEIIKKYESKLACWISEPDKGIYDAMNKAVPLSRGKWIYFLGADDHLLEGFATAVDYLKNEKTLYYGNVYRPIINRIYDGKFSAYKLACRNICHQGIFYPRHIWEKYSYNLKYPILADYELNLRCFADSDIKFEYVPVSIAIFWDEGGVSPTQVDTVFEKDKLALIKNKFPLWIYLLIVIRLFLLTTLNKLRFEKVAVTIYHYLLRIKSNHSKEKSTINKN